MSTLFSLTFKNLKKMTESEMTAFISGRGITDMSSYEHFQIANESAKRPSGVGIAGLAIGSAAALIGIGAWVFGGVYASQGNKYNQRAIDVLANQALAERSERVGVQQLTNKTILDITSGALAGANANATSQAAALAMLLNGGGGHNGQVCPQPVALYQPAMPCCCPTGCNG